MAKNSIQYYIDQEYELQPEELAKLFLTSYDTSYHITNPHYLNWQYLENPYGKAIVSAARSNKDDTLVGIYIVNPISINRIGISAVSLNTFTHQDFRGQGMFTMLARDCYAKSADLGIKSIIGFPNAMSYGGFVKKLGFLHLGDAIAYIRINSYVGLVRGLINWKISERIDFKKYGLTALNLAGLATLEKLFEHYKGQVCIEKSIAYFKWRYYDHPFNQYEIISYSKNSEVLACAVVKQKKKKINELHIMEIIYKSEEAGLELLKRLSKLYKRNTPFMRVISNPLHESHKVYKKFGIKDLNIFRKQKISIPFIYKPLIGEEVIRFDNWNVSLGASDTE